MMKHSTPLAAPEQINHPERQFVHPVGYTTKLCALIKHYHVIVLSHAELVLNARACSNLRPQVKSADPSRAQGNPHPYSASDFAVSPGFPPQTGFYRVNS